MILLGYATTPDAAVDGYTFAGGAIDCSQALPPLYHRHSRPIGRVLCMQYVGDKLLVTVETDDDAGRTANFMSPAARVLAVDGKRVTKAFLTEISLTNSPCNPHCRIIEKRAHDPLVALWRNQLEWHDQIQRFVGVLQKYVALIPTLLAAQAPVSKHAPVNASPRRELTERDRARLAAIHERMAKRHIGATVPVPMTSFGSLVEHLRTMEA